jgi:hypothetical protein
MLVPNRRTRRISLWALALGAALIAPVSAHAAMGGANPEVASLTPNLRTVTLTAVDTTNATTNHPVRVTTEFY